MLDKLVQLCHTACMAIVTADSKLPPTVRLGRGTARGVELPPVPSGAGILHLGLGNFHRAHQAVYTAAALAG